jgi:hypothetical protein
MLASALVVALLASDAKELTAEDGLAEARAWIKVFFKEDVAGLRKETVLPFVGGGDFIPVDPDRMHECKGKSEIKEPDQFEPVMKCMFDSNVSSPGLIPTALVHLKVIRPRPAAWKEPARGAVANRLKSHQFVRTRWQTGCDVYDLTLGIRRDDDGAAKVSLALLKFDLVCE